MLSDRVPAQTAPNALTRQLQARRERGRPYVDLTESNPTRVGLRYPHDLLQGLADARALRYDPSPFGLPAARAAVADHYSATGTPTDPGHIVLTASTSEAYSWLFKVLCNAGDSVLVPRPSYPLFEHLTRLECIRPEPYDLEYCGRWAVDFSAIDAAPATTRAVLVVSPNNPTGSYLSDADLARLSAICAARGWALVADEVFADYPLEGSAPRTTIAARSSALTFTLGGLSKLVGLPQAKLGWILAGGPKASVASAFEALELVADSFLSVGTPVQLAAGDLLARGAVVRADIHQRVRANLATLRRVAAAFPACDVLRAEGGWYTVIRVPATDSEEQLVLAVLEEEGILVHPGYFFDFRREAFLVVSLLPEPDTFADAVTRLLRFASERPAR